MSDGNETRQAAVADDPPRERRVRFVISESYSDESAEESTEVVLDPVKGGGGGGGFDCLQTIGEDPPAAKEEDAGDDTKAGAKETPRTPPRGADPGREGGNSPKEEGREGAESPPRDKEELRLAASPERKETDNSAERSKKGGDDLPSAARALPPQRSRSMIAGGVGGQLAKAASLRRSASSSSGQNAPSKPLSLTRGGGSAGSSGSAGSRASQKGKAGAERHEPATPTLRGAPASTKAGRGKEPPLRRSRSLNIGGAGRLATPFSLSRSKSTDSKGSIGSGIKAKDETTKDEAEDPEEGRPPEEIGEDALDVLVAESARFAANPDDVSQPEAGSQPGPEAEPPRTTGLASKVARTSSKLLRGPGIERVPSNATARTSNTMSARLEEMCREEEEEDETMAAAASAEKNTKEEDGEPLVDGTGGAVRGVGTAGETADEEKDEEKKELSLKPIPLVKRISSLSFGRGRSSKRKEAVDPEEAGPEEKEPKEAAPAAETKPEEEGAEPPTEMMEEGAVVGFEVARDTADEEEDEEKEEPSLKKSIPLVKRISSLSFGRSRSSKRKEAAEEEPEEAGPEEKEPKEAAPAAETKPEEEDAGPTMERSEEGAVLGVEVAGDIEVETTQEEEEEGKGTVDETEDKEEKGGASSLKPIPLVRRMSSLSLGRGRSSKKKEAAAAPKKEAGEPEEAAPAVVAAMQPTEDEKEEGGEKREVATAEGEKENEGEAREERAALAKPLPLIKRISSVSSRRSRASQKKDGE